MFFHVIIKSANKSGLSFVIVSEGGEMMDNNHLHKCFSDIRNGNKTAFEELYNDMKLPVFTVICRIVSDKNTAEDIMQDLFIKLYCSPPAESIKNLRAYIFQTAHNLAIDSTRKIQFDKLSDDISDNKIPFEDCVGIRLDIEKAMQQLNTEEREIVTLHLNAELKFREIANIMEIPIGTALWRYRKAINQLKNNLSGGIV